jgi:hypothetical protein
MSIFAKRPRCIDVDIAAFGAGEGDAVNTAPSARWGHAAKEGLIGISAIYPDQSRLVP